MTSITINSTDSNVALTNVISALGLSQCEPYETNDSSYTACCPAHDDQSPSLSVGVGDDDRVLIKCHAGCDTVDVVEALGLTMADLFNTSAVTSGRATYIYTDENKVPLTKVERSISKDFWQGRWNGEEWESKLGDVRRVVYHLPEVHAAVAAGTTIYVPEGEKDVESLRSHGYIATCNAGGAGKWKTDHADALAGAREVVVVADRDEAGRAHARDITESLQGMVGSIRVVEAAVGKDATDHLDAGLGVVDLVPVSISQGPGSDHEQDTQPAHRSFADKLLTPSQLIDMPEPDWLIDGVLPTGSLVMSYGKPGTFKSFVKLDQALHIATGKRWNGMPTQSGLVCYVAAEDIGGYIYRQRAWIEINGPVSDEYMRYYPEALNLSDGSAVNGIVTWAKEAHPLYVVFDTLRRCTPGVNENDTKDMGRAIDAADRIRRSSGATVDLVHHSDKSGATYRGNSALGGDVDTILQFTASGMNVIMKQEKQKNSAKEETRLKMQLVPLGEDARGRPISSLVARTTTATDYVGMAKVETDKRDAMVNAVRMSPGRTSAAIITSTGMGRTSGYKLLDELERSSVIVSEDGQNKTKLWFPND